MLKQTKLRDLLTNKLRASEAINSHNFDLQITEVVANKLTHGGENFLKTSTLMLKAQLEEAIQKTRTQLPP